MKQPKYVGGSMTVSPATRAKGDSSGGGHKYPKMTAGSVSGKGRLEKIKAYGAKAK